MSSYYYTEYYPNFNPFEDYSGRIYFTVAHRLTIKEQGESVKAKLGREIPDCYQQYVSLWAGRVITFPESKCTTYEYDYTYKQPFRPDVDGVIRRRRYKPFGGTAITKLMIGED